MNIFETKIEYHKLKENLKVYVIRTNKKKIIIQAKNNSKNYLKFILNI